MTLPASFSILSQSNEYSKHDVGETTYLKVADSRSGHIVASKVTTT